MVQKCLRAQRLNRTLVNILNEKQITWSARKIYFSNLFKRNLLKNPSGLDSFNYWCFCDNSNISQFINKNILKLNAHDDDQFYNSIIEHISNLTEAVNMYKKNFVHSNEKPNWKREWATSSNNWSIENTQTGARGRLTDSHGILYTNFVTSYSLGEKIQVIDLDQEGFDDCMLEQMKPEIEISESYTSRFDCGCSYKLCVFIFSTDFELIDFFSHSDTLEEGSENWSIVSHNFRFKLSPRSKKPVRYILFYHNGRVN